MFSYLFIINSFKRRDSGYTYLSIEWTHESRNWQTVLIHYLMLFNLFKEQRTIIFQPHFHENPT